MATKPNGAEHPADSHLNSESEGNDFPVISPASADDSDGSGIPTVDPSEVGSSSDATGKRGRGRPPKNKGGGTGANQYTKAKQQTAQDLTGILMGLHTMCSAFLKVEELELDQDEAKALSDAVNKVQAEYKMPILDPKTLAWINLGMVAGGVYGPRVAAYSLRKKKERKGKPTTIDAQDARIH